MASYSSSSSFDVMAFNQLLLIGDGGTNDAGREPARQRNNVAPRPIAARAPVVSTSAFSGEMAGRPVGGVARCRRHTAR